MKRILGLITVFVLAGQLKAQDSSSVKVTISLEAADVEYIYKHISFREQTEDLYDQVKKKMSATPYPTGTALVQIDTITRVAWVFLYDIVRADAIAVDKLVFKHLTEKLVALNDPYINYRIVLSDTRVNKLFTDDRKTGREKYRRVINQ
jgi:Na+-transporting NADH:ubiquinone oxidoreductase subunit NqrA